MSIIRHLIFGAVRRAAADPRVQRKAVKTVASVDKKMTETADKVAEFAIEKDPVREAGRVVGRFLPGNSEKGR